MKGGLGKLLLYRGTGPVSKLIERFSGARGPVKYSHAAILYPDGKTVIESYEGVGVRERGLNDYGFDMEPFDAFDVQGGMDALRYVRGTAWAKGEIGCGYDYRGVWHFITGQTGADPDKWYCSEFAQDFFIHAGGPSLLRWPSWMTSPRDGSGLL